MRVLVGPLVALVAFSVVGCGGSPASPAGGSTTTTTSPPPPTPTVRTMSIVGGPVMRAIGETARLTAIATFNDNTTRDVTAESSWTSANANLFSVSAGLVTVVGYGLGEIRASFGGRTGFRQVAATPPNTFIFYGRAREPGMSGLPSVRVVETGSNRSVTTDAAGDFQIAALASARTFKFDKDGYENTEIVPDTPQGDTIFVESAMQRVVRLAAGQALTNQSLAPHDVAYVIGSDSCYPCRLIRVTTITSGTLRLTVTGPAAPSLHLWVNGRRFDSTGSVLSADIQVAAGEVPTYVGWDFPLSAGGTGDYSNFSLSTSINGS